MIFFAFNQPHWAKPHIGFCTLLPLKTTITMLLKFVKTIYLWFEIFRSVIEELCLSCRSCLRQLCSAALSLNIFILNLVIVSPDVTSSFPLQGDLISLNRQMNLDKNNKKVLILMMIYFYTPYKVSKLDCFSLFRFCCVLLLSGQSITNVINIEA